MSKGDQKVPTSSFKLNKSWGCDVQHGDHRSAYSKVAKRVSLKSSHHKKNFVTVSDNRTYCGDPFPRDKNVQSLCNVVHLKLILY